MKISARIWQSMALVTFVSLPISAQGEGCAIDGVKLSCVSDGNAQSVT